MKVLFYILSVLAICAAAYFSNVNKSNFLEQQQVRKDTIALNRRVSAEGDKTEAQLKDEKKKLTSAKEENAEVVQSIASLEGKAQGLKRELGEIEAELEEQEQTLADAEKARLEVEKALTDMGLQGPFTMDSIQGNIKLLEDKRKELTQSIGELENNIGAAEKSVARNRDNIDRLSQRKQARNRRIAANAMESVITAVDQDWGFVVVGAGSNSGFSPQKRLIVKRDGRVIAEVKPSSIEASQTIAEIDYETVVPGVRIQPGDRVIISKPAAN
ncbi:hypothetical protein HAHE_03940 [Haloferula helveola]|uniref:Chromosome partition protein Smc n=1 Tax=Haloferula helveola TaxID=490095 RepID=A0ABM7RAE8_9BACT|nr:hypothetical protein HAHE_03940 [Haloferula helveola]